MLDIASITRSIPANHPRWWLYGVEALAFSASQPHLRKPLIMLKINFDAPSTAAALVAAASILSAARSSSGSMLVITGQPIIRKRGDAAPAYVNAGHLGLNAIYAAFERANQAYESFILAGNADAVLAFQLIATARGAGHKLQDRLPVAPAEGASFAAETAVSYIQRKCGGQHLPREWQALGDAAFRAESLLRRLTEALADFDFKLLMQEAPEGSATRYATYLMPGVNGCRSPLTVRVSDHGRGQEGQLNLPYTASLDAALKLVLQHA